MKRSIIIIGILVLLGYGVWIFINDTLSIAQPQATYVGIDKCKTCHPKNFAAFSERKFDKSWRILKMRGKEKDPECLKCHVTGYGEPSGFVSEEATPHLKYKQCEVCHAPGSLHVSDPSNKEYRKVMAPYKYSDKNVCVKCHVCMKTHKEAVF
jgi:hypothetical protein